MVKRVSHRRSSYRITLARASRLHRLLRLFNEATRTRAELQAEVGIGLRTFYRELELLRRCGIKVRQSDGLYCLKTSISEAEGHLPFPDPQLTFAEMAELASGQGPAATRLGSLLESVTRNVAGPIARRRGRKGKPE